MIVFQCCVREDLSYRRALVFTLLILLFYISPNTEHVSQAIATVCSTVDSRWEEAAMRSKSFKKYKKSSGDRFQFELLEPRHLFSVSDGTTPPLVEPMDVSFEHHTESPSESLTGDGLGGQADQALTNFLYLPLISIGANASTTTYTQLQLSADVFVNVASNLVLQWTKISGPGIATFGDSSIASTTVQFDQAGSYLLQFAATNNGTTALAQVLVTVANSEEQLSKNLPLGVNEGGTGTITSSLLQATDVDNTPAQLTYTVTAGPTRGTLRKSGASTTTFTQADINAGLITYQHNGSETTSDSFSFTVNDGQGTSISATFTVAVTAVNDEQTLTANSPLSLLAGATGTISAGLLATSDADNTAAQLVYTVTSSPTNGTLRKSGAATSSFTQADINAGLITYQHNGGTSTSDSFSFSVNDGAGASSTGTFSMSVTPQASGLPDLPQNTLNTTYSLPTGGTTRYVNQGDNLQSVLNIAQPGDVVVLQAGATFTGNFTLPNKTGSAWIYIISSDLAQLPEGERVGPADSAKMARLRSTNKTSLIFSNANAHHYRFAGIEFENTYAATDVTYNIIRLEQGANNITFDRCYIHGSPTGNNFDGISTNRVSNLAVVDSHISEIHVAQGQAESHGIQLLGVNTAKIENNYISAAGINLFIGDNIDTGWISSDLTIRRNHFFKPVAWQSAISSGPNTGLVWKVKNLMEFKEGSRVLVEGNHFENNWAQSQQGHAILFTPRGNAVSDVTFRLNFIDLKDSTADSGIHVGTAEKALDNLLFEDNVIYGHNNRFMTVGNAVGPIGNLIIRHNTVIGTGPTMMFYEGGAPAVNGMKVYDNIIWNGDWGILGTDTGSGLPTITHWTQNYDWNKNLLISTFTYATNSNFRGFLYAGSVGAVGFTDISFDDIADFQLVASSPYKNAGTDGKDIGANIDAILAVMNGQLGGAQIQVIEEAEEPAESSGASPLGESSLFRHNSKSKLLFESETSKSADSNFSLVDGVDLVIAEEAHKASKMGEFATISTHHASGRRDKSNELRIRDALFTNYVEGLPLRDDWEGLINPVL